MTFNIKSKSWLKCLRSDHWNQRYTLCIMGIIGCTCMNANSTIFYHAFEYISSMQGEKGVELPCTNWQSSLAKASYFIGFLSSSIPGSILVDYMGGKTVFGIGCTCSGLGTIFTPILTKHGGLRAVVVLRTIIGAAEALTIPAGLNLLSKWLPSKERGLPLGVFLTAPQLGVVIGYLSSGYMLDQLHWFTCFYIWGGICLVYCVFFFFLCYSEPRSHPFISGNELQFLHKSIPNVPEDKVSFVLRNSIKSVRVWCAIISTIGFYWCFFSILIDLPRYMHRILRFPVAEAGGMISVPFTLMYAVSLSSCYMADFLCKKKVLRRWTMLELGSFFSSVPPSFSIIGAYYSGSRKRALTVCLFGFTLVFMSFYYCGLQVNTLKLSPRNLSLFFAVINTFGGIAAFLAPIVHGFITCSNEESYWYMVGCISSAFLISGMVVHLCFSAENRWWDTQVNVGFDDSNNMWVRLGDLESGKKEDAQKKVFEEEKLKQRNNGVDGSGGTKIQEKLKKEAVDSETTVEIGSDTASSKVSEGKDERVKIKGILKRDAEKSEPKVQQGEEVSSNDSEKADGRRGTKTKGILKNVAEVPQTKEQVAANVVSSKVSEEDDERVKKGILKKDAEESETKEQLGEEVSSNDSEKADGRRGTKTKGILKNVVEVPQTKEQVVANVVSSKVSEEDDERVKKGILKKDAEESETKELLGAEVRSKSRGKDERGGTKTKDNSRMKRRIRKPKNSWGQMR